MAAVGPEEDVHGSVSIQGRVFHVQPRYTDLRYIGEGEPALSLWSTPATLRIPVDIDGHTWRACTGAYGMVVNAQDTELNQRCAIKKVELNEHLSFTRRTLREIKILVGLDHECIVSIQDMMCDNETLNGTYPLSVAALGCRSRPFICILHLPRLNSVRLFNSLAHVLVAALFSGVKPCMGC